MPSRANEVGKPSDRRVRVTVVSGERDALDALAVLSDQLGLESQTLPRQAPFQLDVKAPLGSAKRVGAMLSALGLHVRLDDVPPDAPLSIGFRPEVWAKRDGLAEPLSQLLAMPAARVAAALTQPGGLVLPDLPRAEAERLRRATRRIRGLAATLSDPTDAISDLFVQGPPPAALQHHLRLIGQQGDPVTGALAAGLDQRLCRHLMQRFPLPGLLFIDRAFQRFDILLTGAGRWVSSELADFLTGRTALPRARFETISPESPIRIEVGLTRGAARQFHADYAAMGLETRLALSGREIA